MVTEEKRESIKLKKNRTVQREEENCHCKNGISWKKEEKVEKLLETVNGIKVAWVSEPE